MRLRLLDLCFEILIFQSQFSSSFGQFHYLTPQIAYNFVFIFFFSHKKITGFSVAGKPANPTALSSHPHWCGFCCCNCLFATLVTRVGYLLLQYSALIDACRTREWIRGDSNSRVICISIHYQQYRKRSGGLAPLLLIRSLF